MMAITDALHKADEMRRAGRMAEAGAVYRDVMTAGGLDADTQYRIGLALKEMGQIAGALEAFGQAARCDKGTIEAFVEAAIASTRLGRPDDALQWIAYCAQMHPDRFEPHYFLGTMLASRGRHNEAIESFTRALTLDPSNLEATKGLILSLRRTRRFGQAHAVTKQWLHWLPNDPAVYATQAHMALEQNQYEEALTPARQAADRAPRDPDLAVLVSRVFTMLGRHSEALEELLRARNLAPERADIRVHVAKGFKVAGRLEEAERELHDALAQDPDNATAYFELSEVRTFLPGDSLIKEMERLVVLHGREPKALQRLHYSLGKAYDDIDDPDTAFRHFRLANTLERTSVEYDEATTLAQIDRLTALFTPETIARLSEHGVSSTVPIFIVGMPRSGSTLIEQIIASHPQVAAGGELLQFRRSVDFAMARQSLPFPDCLEALTSRDVIEIGTQYLLHIARIAEGRGNVTDKLPANAFMVALIHLALPQAKIIHCLRDPMDTCLSCYMKSFGARVGYANDLEMLGRHYRRHQAMIDHWRRILPPDAFLDVQYEDVVGNLENQARRIIAYCGLEWDERCLAFHETKRPVHTASVAQVRQPIYNRSVGRWRLYGPYLGPLRQALGDLISQ